MLINADITAINAMTDLLLSESSTSGSSQTGSLFGPAATFSFSGTSSFFDGTYSQLASLALMTPANTAAMPSQQLTEAEAKALDDAFTLIENGLFNEAESALNSILQKNKTNAVAIHATGIIKQARGNYEEAETLFRRANFLAPGRGYGEDADNARLLGEDDETVVEEAAKLIDNPSTREQAISLLLHVVERSPGRADAKIELGEGLIAKGDVLNGLNYLMNAITIGDQDEISRIKDQAEELVELLPAAPQVHRLLGRAQVHLGQYEEALATLAVATQLSGTDLFHKSDLALAHIGIGREMLAKGDDTRALAKFKEARTLDPMNSEVGIALAEGYLAKAEKLLRLGDTAKAIQSFYDASNSVGSNGPDHLRRRIASGAYSAGLRMEAKHTAAGEDIDEEALAYQAAYNLDGDNAAYKRKLAETRSTIGDQYVAEGEYVQAIGAYKRAHELYRNDTTYKDNLVNAYNLRGDELMAELNYDEAIKAYRDGFQVDTYNQTVKSNLAEAYNTRGLDYVSKEKYLQAVADFKEALALFPDNADYQANYDSVAAYDS